MGLCVPGVVWGVVNKTVFVAARIVENGLSHCLDCIFHSENCLPLPFPEPGKQTHHNGAILSSGRNLGVCKLQDESCQHLLQL